MTTRNTTPPNDLTETTLDEISGGPHFRTWDPPTYVAKGSADSTVRKWDISDNGDAEGSGHYTQLVWATTR